MTGKKPRRIVFRPRSSFFRRARYFLPFASYLKAYCWLISLFLLFLAFVSFLLGRYAGFSVAVAGGAAIGVIVLVTFLAVLVMGVVLNVMDREEG